MSKLQLILISLILLLLTGCSSIYVDDGVIRDTNGSSIVDSQGINTLDKDYAGRQSTNDLFGYDRISIPCDISVVNFQFNIPPNHVLNTSTGSGSTYALNSLGNVEVGSGNGFAQLRTVETIRYHSGHESYAYFTAIFDNGATGIRQNIGLKSDQDGVYLCKEGTEFGVCLKAFGTEERITTFNGEDITRLNVSLMNIYRISYGWLGIAPLTIEVYLDREWKVLHVFDKTNAQTIPSIANPNLPLLMEINKTNADANTYTLSTGSWNMGFMNGANSFECNAFFTYLEYDNQKTIAANTLTNLFTVKAPETYFGKENTILGDGLGFSFSTEGNKPVDIILCANANLSGEVYTNISYAKSPSQVDENASINSCDNVALRIKLDGTDSEFININELGLRLLKGNSFTIAAISQNTNIVSASVRWREER